MTDLTFIETPIASIADAEAFLTQLNTVGMVFHPEDDAHDIEFDAMEITEEQADALNARMEECYDLGEWDPCEFIMDNLQD